eukprot:TRINITY_DN5931_c0_g1_i1.p1 TRINITY_DN5931_c0_g1~~TRINITY_DN5931_c0_g1_i1.p1  ORF type:complete len:119 (-),score=4.05 TRINITY_DN5931_c0_g1_i1:103-459(-)
MNSFHEDDFDLSVGRRIDLLLHPGEMVSGIELTKDEWVLATIAAVKSDQVLIHVGGGKARWVAIGSPELAPPGSQTHVAASIATGRSYLAIRRETPQEDKEEEILFRPGTKKRFAPSP